jgi:hypothetical protein
MKIYILVLVRYDYYRFQENIYAHTNKEKVFEFINNHRDKLPVYEYTEESAILRENETEHWWIEEFEVL